jgi:type I restriction enzyme, S subunit
MKNLETLINELCPDGVEFQTMEEIFEIRNGYTPSKNNPDFWENGTIPWFRMEDIRQNGRILSDAIQHITPAAIKGKGLFPVNSIIIATTATIGEHALVIADSLANQRFTNLTVRKSLTDRLLPKFVFYYMFVIDEWCKKNVNAGNFASVDMKRFKKIEFPLPPIEVQTEIVRILDKFTELEAELEAELDCRKRQYEYYRDKLLSFENVGGQNVTIGKIGDLGKICMCKRIMKNQTNSEGGIPFYKIGTFGKQADAYISNEVYEEYKRLYSYPKKGDVLMSAAGTIGRTVVFNGEPSYFQDSNIVWVDNDESKVLNSYLNYYYQIIEWKTQGGTIKRLYNNLLANAIIKYPSLAEQERIVSILDRFESLTTSLTAGLPAEIAARRQQYEHYRDKLLTFKRKSA